MEEHPERADTLLSSLEDSVTELSTPQRIQYYLLRAEASYKLDKQNFIPNNQANWLFADYDTRNIIYLSIKGTKIKVTYFINNDNPT